jgi:phosphoribosylaminoimidazolecarboxamide formyltransferase/IMP cyclohydrolase
MVMSEPYTTRFKSARQFAPAVVLDKDRILVAQSYRPPTPQEAEDMLFAWYICANTRSNAIVFAKDGAAIAIGTGQQERVGAIEQAIDKAYQKATDKLVQAQSWDLERAMAFVKQTKGGLEGAVIASDGFMPKSDNIETIAKEGVTGVVQPGGSKEDQAIVELANKNEIAVAFTEERCFSHF